MNIIKGTRIGRTVERLRRGDDSDPSPECKFLLTAIWILSGIVAVFVPLIHRTIHKNKYEKLYSEYYWEQEMQEYEQTRQENYEKYGNSYVYNKYNGYGGYGGYNTENQAAEQQAQTYFDVNRCRWFDWNCVSFYVNGEGEVMQEQGFYPNWYNSFATTEEQLAEMEKERQQPGSMKFVYIWQLIMFSLIVAYGVLVIRQNRNPSGLIVALLVWANYAFCAMWMLADGSIATDGWVVKRSGFYGQTAVLIFMSNFWYFVHGLVFCIVFWVRKIQQDKNGRKMEDTNKSVEDAEAESYHAPSDPDAGVSTVQRVPPAAATTPNATPVTTKEQPGKDLLDVVFDPIEKTCFGHE